MKRFSDIQDNDPVYVRIMYDNIWETKEIRSATVERAWQDEDQAARLAGIKRSVLRFVQMKHAPNLVFKPADGDTNRIQSGRMIYYTEIEPLIDDLNKETEIITNRIKGFIMKLKDGK